MEITPALFVKGSMWKTTEGMKINGSEIPIGSVFEVVYPRRRENNQVALHFLDVKVKKRKGSGRSKGRYGKADALIPFKRLTHCELVDPGNEVEYFIRIVGTDKLWLGHRGEVITDDEGRTLPTRVISKPRFCSEAGWDHANHYVSLNNAITGVVTIMFKHYPTLDKVGREVQALEIIGRNPINETITETHTIGGDWWSNVIALARVGRSYKTDKTIDTPRTRLQRLATALPLDCPKWNFVALFSASYLLGLKTENGDFTFKNGRKQLMAKLSEIGFHEKYHLQGEGELLFSEDSDRVLLKLALNDKDVDIHNL